MINFILGMLMVQMFFPLIDGLTALILSGLEALKGYFSIKVTEYNAKMRKMVMEDDESKMNPIGFAYEEEEEDEQL